MFPDASKWSGGDVVISARHIGSTPEARSLFYYNVDSYIREELKKKLKVIAWDSLTLIWGEGNSSCWFSLITQKR